MNIKKNCIDAGKKDKKLTVKKLENKILNRQMLRKKNEVVSLLRTNNSRQFNATKLLSPFQTNFT